MTQIPRAAHVASTATPASTRLLHPNTLRLLQRAAFNLLRYGVVFFLLLFGAFKFFEFEARSIQPLMENSPLMSWTYAVFGVRGASRLLGVIEITLGVVMSARRVAPRACGIASFLAAGMFLVTLSFLLTTPGVRDPSSILGGFLMKDLILLGASLYTGCEALLADAGES